MTKEKKKKWTTPQITSLTIEATDMCTGGGVPRGVKCINNNVPPSTIPCSHKHKNTAFS
jgi:hypothetical protein